MSVAGLEHALDVLRGGRLGVLRMADIAVVAVSLLVLVRYEYLRAMRRLPSRAWAGRIILAAPAALLLLGLVVLRRMVDY